MSDPPRQVPPDVDYPFAQDEAFDQGQLDDRRTDRRAGEHQLLQVARSATVPRVSICTPWSETARNMFCRSTASLGMHTARIWRDPSPVVFCR
jgi:hypothetical protein